MPYTATVLGLSVHANISSFVAKPIYGSVASRPDYSDANMFRSLTFLLLAGFLEIFVIERRQHLLNFRPRDTNVRRFASPCPNSLGDFANDCSCELG
jgi:hypothetical protein